MTNQTHDRPGQAGNGAESGRIWKARNFIAEHAGEELSLRKVAKAADTSANYLSEKFKEATGINFVKYVARMRFEKAAALLRQSDLRVSEIAFASGFQSLSQFNRVFKKLSGRCPIEYRAVARAMKEQPGRSPRTTNSSRNSMGPAMTRHDQNGTMRQPH